jgi:UDP-2-acetamido-3-amino-2,3-dideoxy-glucuronate N-acetyltransferase
MSFSAASPHPYHHGATRPTGVVGAQRIALVQRRDERGPLAVLGQDEAPLPFVPKRVFITYEANERSRGAHAHRICEQILICVSGSVRVRVRDGVSEEVVELSSPAEGLYVGQMVWAEEFEHSLNAVILVLASHAYDEGDYVRDPAVWRAELRAMK